MKPKYSVVLPVYNEEKNVWLIAEKYDKINKRIPIEVLFVEDSGSTDNTRGELKKIAKKYPFVKNVFTNEQGYGISVNNGLKKTTSNVVCWTHSDMQTDPYDTVKAYKLLRKQNSPRNSFIKGRRRGRPLFDSFFTVGMSAFETIILFTGLDDINAQPNMFHKDFLAKVGEPPKDFSFDLYFYYMAKKLKCEVVRFPVFFKARIHGQSHWNTSLSAKWKFIKRTIDFSFKMKKMLKK